MPKIACVTPMYFSDDSCIGGGERYPLNLSRGIVESTGGAYTVEIISFGPRSRVVPLAPGLTMRVLQAARPPQHPLDVVSWELPSALIDADLVHIHQAYTRCTEMAILVAKQQGKPIVVTDHGGPSSMLGNSVGCLEMVDHIISYSNFGKAAYKTSTSTPITVVKGGVDATMFTPPEARPERSHILYVGRLLPHKGIDRLITATPADIPLTVCGRPYHADYFARLQGLAAGKDVTFVTDADDAATLDLYRRAWGHGPAVGLSRLLRQHLSLARADGLHPAGVDVLRHARHLLRRGGDARVHHRRREPASSSKTCRCSPTGSAAWPPTPDSSRRWGRGPAARSTRNTTSGSPAPGSWTSTRP